MGHEQTPLEKRIALRSEFAHEAPRFTNAISEPMKEFVLDRINYILDEYNMLAIVQPTHDTESV